VVADFYTDTPELSTAAFAAVSFSNGLAGAIGYFTFAEASRLTMAGLVMVTSLVAIACYLIANHIHQNQQTTREGRLAKYQS
jgi:hypothetical protein